MVGTQRLRAVALVLAGGLLAAVLLPLAAAVAAVDAETAAARIAEDYGVEVLKVRAGERDGRKVWLVTVMMPGGNRNNAFQVHLLAVDQETGALVPSFRHNAAGYDLPPLPPGGVRP